MYDVGGKLIAEYGGPETSGAGGLSYVMQDWQGSTRVITNAHGFVKSRNDYTAFGEDIASGTGLRTENQGFGSSDSLRQKYGLTERDDATGLDHTWFRKHETQAGRWTSPDPYNGSMNLGDPQSFNRYSYVANQPTNYVDPSGLDLEPGCYVYISGTIYPDGRVDIEHEIRFCIGGNYTSGPQTGGTYGSVFVGGSGTSENSDDCDSILDKARNDSIDLIYDRYGINGRFLELDSKRSGTISKPVDGLVERVHSDNFNLLNNSVAFALRTPENRSIDLSTAVEAANINANLLANIYGNNEHQFTGFYDNDGAKMRDFYHNRDAMERSLKEIFRNTIQAASDYANCRRSVFV